MKYRETITIEQFQQALCVNIKKLNKDAVIPRYSREGDAAVDLVATSKVIDPNNRVLTFGTGLAIEIPLGYVGKLYPRSSIYKTGLVMCNSVGIIDSNYRGEIQFKFKIIDAGDVTYQIGDRIGQLIIEPVLYMDFTEVQELTDTNRGESGFGSSGR
jgi:dUTP pyrophosphatase